MNKISSLTEKEILSHQIKKNSHENKIIRTTRKKRERQLHIDIILNFFPEAKNVLCIGCRDISEINSFINNGFSALGIDILSINSHHYKQIDAHKLNSVFGRSEFDLVYASHSLEHMYDIEKVLKNIRFVSSQGCFIVLPWYNEKARKTRGRPNIDHPTVFNVMVATKKKHENFLEMNDDLLRDFVSFGSFQVLHSHFSGLRTKKGISEYELLFKWN